jgi:DNA-directed RNA polymerase specialized sigma subunit
MADIIAELRKLGKKNPQLLLEKLEKMELTSLEFIILKSRYIDRLFFKQIPEVIGKSESWMYKVHKQAIKKIDDNIIWLIC